MKTIEELKQELEEKKKARKLKLERERLELELEEGTLKGGAKKLLKKMFK